MGDLRCATLAKNLVRIHQAMSAGVKTEVYKTNQGKHSKRRKTKREQKQAQELVNVEANDPEMC